MLAPFTGEESGVGEVNLPEVAELVNGGAGMKLE